VGAVNEVRPGQRGKGHVGGKELPYLVLGRAPAEDGQAPDQLDVGEIACRDLVVAALAVVGQALDRPRPDSGDGAQTPPGRLVARQIGSARRHLPGGANKRERPLGRQPTALDLGR